MKNFLKISQKFHKNLFQARNLAQKKFTKIYQKLNISGYLLCKGGTQRAKSSRISLKCSRKKFTKNGQSRLLLGEISLEMGHQKSFQKFTKNPFQPEICQKSSPSRARSPHRIMHAQNTCVSHALGIARTKRSWRAIFLFSLRLKPLMRGKKEKKQKMIT